MREKKKKITPGIGYINQDENEKKRATMRMQGEEIISKNTKTKKGRACAHIWNIPEFLHIKQRVRRRQ